MHQTLTRALLFSLAATVLLISPCRAQQDLQVGNFHLRLQTDPITDQDRSLAILYPTTGRDGTGLIMWACSGSTGELVSGVRLANYGTTRSVQQVVWRFDSDRPDSTYLEGGNGGQSWFLRAEDAPPFTVRAKTATRLVIRVLGGAPTYSTTDYFYDLRGSAAALNRLSCARNPVLLGRRTDEVREETPAGGQGEVELTYELSAVEEQPRPTNLADLARQMERNYPPLLRDARVTGTVHLRFRLLEDGSVDASSIQVTSSSHEQFNDPSIRAIQRLRFRPAKLNGIPVRVWVDLPLQWSVS